ncbi:MAG: DUF4159 domain-containing protein [Planctomycetia bacterium]|nr:DUF4159 domain-containing protein [Planctomycetia bacterium]
MLFLLNYTFRVYKLLLFCAFLGTLATVASEEAWGADPASVVGDMATGGVDLSPELVQKSIDEGVEYLRSRQKKNGSWDEYPGYEPGSTALCTLALLSCGLTKDDPSVAKALDYLRTPLPASQYQTYPISLMTMVFALADPKRDLVLIQKNVDWLIAKQFRTSNVFRGGWSYVGDRPEYDLVDNSNSQFAILALFEAERAGVRIPEEVWTLAEEYWLGVQNKDGSWGYRASLANLQLGNSGLGTGSMTCAGIAALVITGGVRARGGAAVDGERILCCQESEGKVVDGINKGLDWLAKHFSVQTNPGTTAEIDTWVFYYLYGLERVGRLTANRFIGDNDWYREGTDFLLRRKGLFAKFWKAQIDLKENHSVSTAFALLFLSKGRRPVLVSKLKPIDDATWNSHPNDLLHLTQYAEKQWHRDLIWQIIDGSKATTNDLLQTPVVYMCGTNSPVPQDGTKKRKLVAALRGYLEQGGFLLAESLDGDISFEAGFRDLMREVLPDQGNELRLLDVDHPIWSAERPIDPAFLRPVYGIDFGCRTSVLFLPPYEPEEGVTPSVNEVRPSLSCLWELGPDNGRNGTRPDSVNREVNAGLDLGLNIMAYATNRELKVKEGRPKAQREVASAPRSTTTLQVALLNFSGAGGCASRAIPNLMHILNDELGIPASNLVTRVEPGAKELFENPVLFMHGRTAFHFSDAERNNMKLYIERGGFLFANALCASPAFTKSFQEEMRAIFPEETLTDIPKDDPLYTNRYGGFSIETVSMRKAMRRQGRKMESVESTSQPELKGIKRQGRWVVVFSPYDVSCALENSSGLECSGYTHQSAFQIAVNVVLYAVEHL